MSLRPSTIAALLEAGVPKEHLDEIVAAIERDFANDDAVELRRASDRMRQTRYRMRRRMSPAAWETVRGQVIARDGTDCAYCGNRADPPNIEHMLPLSRGGTNDLDNLCVSCGPCNSSKGDQTLEEWTGNGGKWAR